MSVLSATQLTFLFYFPSYFHQLRGNQAFQVTLPICKLISTFTLFYPGAQLIVWVLDLEIGDLNLGIERLQDNIEDDPHNPYVGPEVQYLDEKSSLLQGFLEQVQGDVEPQYAEAAYPQQNQVDLHLDIQQLDKTQPAFLLEHNLMQTYLTLCFHIFDTSRLPREGLDIIRHILFLVSDFDMQHLIQAGVMHVAERALAGAGQFFQGERLLQTYPAVVCLSVGLVFRPIHSGNVSPLKCQYEMESGILLNQKRQTKMDNAPEGMGDKHTSLKQCPYISTIRKNMLDFDFEKICSISLAHTNVYACLVCGRYFQGRSSTSPAYQHSIQFSHYIFMNLQNSKVYCIPDDYEVDTYTLNDVKFNLRPLYTNDSLHKLEKMEDVQYNVDGKQYYPGVMGLNNLGKTDFASVVIYMLNAVLEIRRFFVLAADFDNQLLNQFTTLLKKVWNPKSFKGLVSPHQFLQAITDASGKKFKIGSNSDPATFFLWLIDNLNKGMKKEKGVKFDIQKLFRGKLKTSIIKGIKDSYEYEQIPTKIEEVQFSILKFEFPEKGVFNKTQSQISLDFLLQKYIGKVGEKHELGLRYAKIIEFPQYLVLVFKRFASNGYSVEKDNSHLVYSLKLNISSNNCTGYYRLLSQVCHSGDFENGKYKIIMNMEEAERWFQVEDLEVKEVIEKQVLLAQPIIQMYRLVKLEPKMKELL